MGAKEALVRKSAFPSLPTSFLSELVVTLRITYQTVTKDMIHKAIMTQSTFKILGPDKFNFRILHMVWGWDSKRFITMI